MFCILFPYRQREVLRCLLLLSISLSSLKEYSQELRVINSAGGSDLCQDILFDWSFGEMISVRTLYSNSDFMVTSGFLQSRIDTFEKFLPIGPGDTNRIMAGPNPTHSLVTIRSTIAATGKILIRITNSNGQLIKQYEELHESLKYQKQLNISALPSGTYILFISFFQNGQAVKTAAYRIIKS